jgi:hypothetical protein
MMAVMTRSRRPVAAPAELVRARTCYDHLAGRLGVALLDALCDKGYVDRAGGLSLTSRGSEWLTELGVDVREMRRSRRPVVRECLDWTERRPHLAGAAGAVLCDRMFHAGWVERTSRPRAVRVTEAGALELWEQLSLEFVP